MATVLYINPDPATQSRATQLGCGWMPAVPKQFQSVAPSTPCVILAGAGKTVVLSEPTTPQAVGAALQPILDAEAAVSAETAAEASNATTIQANLLGSQATIQQWIAAHPTGATLTAAQTLVVAKMLNGLCKILLDQFSDTAGT